MKRRATVNIWLKYPGYPPEVIEWDVPRSDVARMLREYALVYRNTPGLVWAGGRRDMPR